MGYDTKFAGRFNFDRPLTVAQCNALKSVARVRHEEDGAPSLYCQWIPTEDGMGLEWEGGEKFYAYVEWLTYLITHFFLPWGIVVNGTVYAQGEEAMDRSVIVVDTNDVKVYN